MLIIGPVSMAANTRSADMDRSASRLGARSLPPSWHDAQVRSYNDDPSWPVNAKQHRTASTSGRPSI
jgi:hypothetical protein